MHVLNESLVREARNVGRQLDESLRREELAGERCERRRLAEEEERVQVACTVC